jgi:membrane-associated protein
VNLTDLIGSVSVVGALLVIGALVWAESGLLIGLLLPGDTLLITAGFFVAQGKLPLVWTVVVILVAAVLGDNTGYLFGKKTGPRVFRKNEGIFFRQDQLAKAEQFYQKHGGKTVMFARSIPYARTVVPIIAGIGNMQRLRFVAFNIAGAVLWVALFVSLGYWFGVEVAKQIAHYIAPAIIVSVLFALSPAVIFLVRTPRARALLKQKMKTFIGRFRSRSKD